MKRKMVLLGLSLCFTALLAGCGKEKGKNIEEIQKGNQALAVSVHDPSIVKGDGKYYLFGSHMTQAVSEDLKSFKMLAEGVKKTNRLFDNLFDEDMAAFAYVGNYVDGGYGVWAPDVIYNKEMSKWVMYFCTTHDYRTSNLCMATADNVEGPYHYEKTLLYSGFNRTTVDQTNFFEIMGEDADLSPYISQGQYNHLKYPNCIDPTVFYDKEDRMWVVYGSWSGGIYLLEVDKESGELIHPEADEENKVDAYFGYYLCGGLHNSCEGPYILYDDESGYYYLFVSYGGLTREGGYQIRQFRSEQVTGPYVDAKGESLGYVSNHSQYGIKMMGNYSFPSLKTAYMAPGHNSALKDDDGNYYLVYHQRFDNGSEYHEPRVHQMFLNADGWFVASPFAYTQNAQIPETAVNEKEVAGSYYVVNHGSDISNEIHQAEKWIFDAKGNIKTEGVQSGTYTIHDQNAEIDILIEDVLYRGIIRKSVDEAGNPIQFISAVGNNNETIWCVMYLSE